MGEIPYLFWVSTCNRSDFKISNLFAYPDHRDSPATTDYYIFRQMLCQTAKPSEEDLDKVKARAEALLKQTDVDDWVVDQCYIKKNRKLRFGSPSRVYHCRHDGAQLPGRGGASPAPV